MNILLIDDHAETRKEMAALINAEKDLAVVAEAVTGEEGVVKTCELKPDLVVMDIFLPGINGIEATKNILANNPAEKILVLSNYSGHILVQAILKAGALGYVRKGNAFEELVPAVRSIAVGKQYLGKGIND
ncbi:MAG: response regulator transcription factor [Kiritimatiellae bacterium]|nr:response regulator transcription factor [Kiritimatiellia bacterium]